MMLKSSWLTCSWTRTFMRCSSHRGLDNFPSLDNFLHLYLQSQLVQCKWRFYVPLGASKMVKPTFSPSCFLHSLHPPYDPIPKLNLTCPHLVNSSSVALPGPPHQPHSSAPGSDSILTVTLFWTAAHYSDLAHAMSAYFRAHNQRQSIRCLD